MNELPQNAWLFDVKFVFVGDPAKINGQKREFPIRISKAQFEKGTLQFLKEQI